MYSDDREQYPEERRQENPRFGERGRAISGEYTLELTPEQEKSPVNAFRERPLQRRGVFALREASHRKADANQRWYRVYTPSVPARDGGRFQLIEKGSIQNDLLRRFGGPGPDCTGNG